ncbi:hypothetical protein B0T14DRAFT_565692 [Immersiella caudata]|uniref:Uncharacterized protein n=1 Tax=Immersiella caudata TaxID=314043 RepID=A0AA39WZX0_9PEZI|nr:hypothetical protein B0T14DRAFT_565692 [Immersiella caudata]
MTLETPVNDIRSKSTAQDILLLGFTILSIITIFRVSKLPPNSDISTLLGQIPSALSYGLSIIMHLFQTARAFIASRNSYPGSRSARPTPTAHTEGTLLSGSIGLISHVLCVVVFSGIDTDGCSGYVTRLFITLRRQLLAFIRRGVLHGAESPSSSFAKFKFSRSVTVPLASSSSSSVCGDDAKRGTYHGISSGPEPPTQQRGGVGVGAWDKQNRRAVRRGVPPCIPERGSSLGKVHAIVPHGWRRDGRSWGQLNWAECDLDSRLFGGGGGSALRGGETA